MTDDIDEDIEAAASRQRRAPVSTLVSIVLVAIAGASITWNALYNQRPKTADLAARTIELKAERPAAKPAAKPKPQTAAAQAAKPAAKAGAAEVAVEAGTARPAAGEASAQTVAALQVQLAALGLYAGPANGALDAATNEAVDAYRAQNGLDRKLPLDGVLDHARFAAEIVQAANFRPEGDGAYPATDSATDGAATDGAAPDGAAPDGAAPDGGAPDGGAPAAAKDEVLFVQKGLAELGYAPGPADGHLGEITRRAIRDFQAERRLPVSGEITPGLIAELKKTSGLTTFLTRP